MKISQSSSKRYADWFAGLDRELIAGFRNGKGTFLSSESILNHLNIYAPVPRQRLAFQLIRNAHKRAGLNKHVRAHLILWRMKRKKTIHFKGGRKRELPLANINHTALACYFSRLRLCRDGAVWKQGQSQEQTAGQPLGMVPTPLQKMLHAFLHATAYGLDDAASTGNVPITARGVKVPMYP